MEEWKIIAKCQAWELDYFSHLYDNYIDKIYSFVYLKTSSKEVSEDIVSDVFLSALNKISSYKLVENASFGSWLYRIASNKVIDYYRMNKVTEDVWDYLDMSIQNDIVNDIDNKDKLEKVLSFISELKEDQKQIMMLRIWDDLSYKEIADITGKSVDTCKKTVSRTLKKISGAIATFILILFAL